MAKIVSKKAYLSAVAKKLNAPKTKMLLQFGQTWNPKAIPVRDRMGMAETQKTILRSAANLYDMTAGRVAFSQQMSNFSAGAATYEDVSDVRTVGAVDLTIIAMATSLVPFLAIDRGMAATDDTIFYNDLVAVNTAGGVQAGDVVSGNFTPPNVNVDLAGKASATIAYAGVPAGGDSVIGVITRSGIVLDKTIADIPESERISIIPKSVTGNVLNGEIEIAKVYSSDVVDRDGVSASLLFAHVAGSMQNIPTGTINYKTGEFALDGSEVALSINLTYQVDAGANQTATSGDVLIVEPKWTALPLKSEPQNIILQNNLMNMMYMSKVNAIATGKVGNLYTDTVFQRVRNTYIESINAKIIRGMVASVAKADVVVDLASYNGNGSSTDGRVGTKNDLICAVVANMKAAMLAKSGCGMTSIVANSVAVAMMELVPVLFSKAPNINAGLNGLVGYFMDVPVYRHNALDHFGGKTIGDQAITVADAILFGAFRTADNTSGSQVYGEYLPFTNSGNVGNFAMPTQQANGFFSMVAHKVIDPRLITFGLIKGGSGLYAFGANL